MSKRLWLQIHRYCGLGVALFLLVQALTGALLIYHRPMAQLVDPGGMVRQSEAPDLPLAEIIGALNRAMPGHAVWRIGFPRKPDETYFVYLADPEGGERFASVDPGSGEILRQGSAWRFPMHALMLLHYTLMAGDAGLVLLIVFGAAALSSVISGLVYWWPRASWQCSLRVDRRLSSRLILRQVHRSLGVVIAIMLMGIFATGLLRAGQLLSLSVPAAERPPSLNVSASDAALAVARREFPDLAVRDVRVGGPGLIAVNFLTSSRNSLAVHTVRVAATSGAIVGRTLAEEGRNPGAFLVPVHTAERFGVAGRTLLLAVAIGLIMLTVSGPIMWLHARRRPAAQR